MSSSTSRDRHVPGRSDRKLSVLHSFGTARVSNQKLSSDT